MIKVLLLLTESIFLIPGHVIAGLKSQGSTLDYIQGGLNQVTVIFKD